MDKKKIALIIILIVIFIGVLGAYYFYQPSKSNSTITPNRNVINITYLPSPQLTGTMSVETAIQNRRSVRHYTSQGINLTDVSQILWSAQGITDNQSNLRAAPSAGQVYPLEMYVVVGNKTVTGLSPGVYHYVPSNNTLEKTLNGDLRSQLSSIADGQQAVDQAPVDFVITGNYQKMINKYKDPTLCTRFVDLEAGHAGENIYLEAGSRGLVTVAIGSFNETQMVQLMELPQNETPLYIFPMGHGS
jgi:SagB-type dehydrogenase family enzyme